MFIKIPFCPTWLKGTSRTCSITCGVLSPVSTTPGCSGFSRNENHPSWLVISLDAPETTYHTSFYLEVFFFIKLALCLIIEVQWPFSSLPGSGSLSIVWALSVPLSDLALIWCGIIRLRKLRQNRLNRIATECSEEGLMETLHREYTWETEREELKTIFKITLCVHTTCFHNTICTCS